MLLQLDNDRPRLAARQRFKVHAIARVEFRETEGVRIDGSIPNYYKLPIQRLGTSVLQL